MSFFHYKPTSNSKSARFFLIFNILTLWSAFYSPFKEIGLNWVYPFKIAYQIQDSSTESIVLVFIVLFALAAQTLLPAIFLGFWIRGTYNNMRVFPHLERLFFSRSQPWCTVLPVINLYLPFFILYEVYEETQFAFDEKNIPIGNKLNTRFIKILWIITIVQAINSIVFLPILELFLHHNSYSIVICHRLFTLLLAIAGVYAGHRIVSDYNKIEQLVVHYSVNENEPDEKIF